ncbi:hypothetical protein UT5_12470 [Ferrigenium sp. UT5]
MRGGGGGGGPVSGLTKYPFYRGFRLVLKSDKTRVPKNVNAEAEVATVKGTARRANGYLYSKRLKSENRPP